MGKLWYHFVMIEIRKWTSAKSGSPFYMVLVKQFGLEQKWKISVKML